MAAALDVDREAIKTLAVAVGITEASRRTGVSHEAIRKWSSREGWFKPTKLPPTKVALVTNVTIAPSRALQNSLEADSLRTKTGFSAAAKKVAEHLGKAPVAKLLQPGTAGSAKNWVGVAGQVHGWQGEAQPIVNIALLSGDGSRG